MNRDRNIILSREHYAIQFKNTDPNLFYKIYWKSNSESIFQFIFLNTLKYKCGSIRYMKRNYNKH